MFLTRIFLRRAPRAIAAVILAAAVMLPARSAAQGTPMARMEGRIVDSVHARPLAHASVLAIRLSSEPQAFLRAESDEAGHFRFDSLVAGRYAVSFTGALLDSLDLVIPDREVVLAAGEQRSLTLAIPSGATLRAAACPELALDRGRGAVVGTVTEAATERAIAGATVVAGWAEIVVDSLVQRATRQMRTAAVTTDSLGRYRLCGVPTDSWLAIQVQHAGASSSAVDVMVRDSAGLLLRNLSFSAEDTVVVAREDSGGRESVRLPASTGTAVLTGVVLGTAGTPLSGAQLRIANARGAVFSDSLGRFTLVGLPAGSQMLEARRIGYAMIRLPVELRSGRAVEQRVQLMRVISLDSVRVVARRRQLAEFERHRTGGWGKFLDEADILTFNPLQTSDLVRMMPGFRVVGNGAAQLVVSTHAGFSFDGRVCPVNVVINGMSNMDINMVHPTDITAFEAYNSNVGMPPEYASQSPCGAIVIWTKR